MTETKILGNGGQGKNLPELIKQASRDTKINKIIEEEQKLKNAVKNAAEVGFGPFETNQPIIAFFDKSPNQKEFGDRGGELAGYYSGHHKEVIMITNQLYPGKLIGGNYSPEGVLELTAADRFDNENALINFDGSTGIRDFLFEHKKSIVEVLVSEAKDEKTRIIGFMDTLPFEDDFGFFQLYRFKDENDNLHGLVKDVYCDSSVLEITVFEPDISENLFMRMEPSVSSLKILAAIERNFNYKGFPGDLRLFTSDARKGESYYTHSNALLALAYAVSNKTEKTKKIMGAIENKIGFSLGLITSCLECGFLQTGANAALALAYFGMGRKRKAVKLIEGIEEKMRFEDLTGLYCFENANGVQCTQDNALLAVAYSLLGKRQKALSIIKAIEKYICFDESGLITNSTNSSSITSKDNALLALAYFSSGQGEKGAALVDNIESKFGYNKETGLLYDDYFSPKTSLGLAGNAAFSLALMAKEEYMKK